VNPWDIVGWYVVAGLTVATLGVFIWVGWEIYHWLMENR